ncbi:hypothetical protein L7F22_042383 [Adiantum nelumboides]|nr:hypothetical protein [Adiantum nelumboides]
MTVPRSEHPRPDWVRTDRHWSCLNGPWKFAFDDLDEGLDQVWQQDERRFNQTITVPFAFQTEASGINDKDIHEIGESQYSSTLVRMQAHNCDDPFAFTLLQSARLARGSPKEPHRAASIKPDIDQGTIAVNAELLGVGPSSKQSTREARLAVQVSLAGIPISRSDVVISNDTASAACTLTVSVPGSSPPEKIRKNLYGSGILPPELEGDSWSGGLALWSPDHPSLYDVTLSLLSADGSETLDKVETYVGMRKISINEEGKICLNNRPYFMALNLDQGYWPKSNLTAPSDEAFKQDILKMKEIGMNGARAHQRVADPRYLYHADKLGYLIWAEMPNAYEYSHAYVERFTQEWLEAMKRDMNHPCIVAWVPINESWGVPNLATSAPQRDHLLSLYHLTRSLDDSRLVVDNDGWEHSKTTICTFHDYAEHASLRKTCASLASLLAPKASRAVYNPGSTHAAEPIVLSEFGGVSLAGGAKGWGYNEAGSAQDLLGRIRGLVDAVLDGGLVQGYCYTQTADCETEVNGLLTAQREHKLDVAELRKIFGRRS